MSSLEKSCSNLGGASRLESSIRCCLKYAWTYISKRMVRNWPIHTDWLSNVCIPVQYLVFKYNVIWNIEFTWMIPCWDLKHEWSLVGILCQAAYCSIIRIVGLLEVLHYMTAEGRLNVSLKAANRSQRGYRLQDTGTYTSRSDVEGWHSIS